MTTPAFAVVAYDYPGAVAASGIGLTKLKAAVSRGDLIAHYEGVKVVIRAADLDDYIKSLPTEKH